MQLKHDYDPKDFGASGNGTTKDHQAIQAAIDACNIAGGGTVTLKNGRFLSGAIFLKADVRLIIENDATLLGSQDLADYPSSQTRFEGRTVDWPCALVNATKLDGLRIEGEGTIDGNAEPFWRAFWADRQRAVETNSAFSNRDARRPRLLYLKECTNLAVTGLRLVNSGFWTLHLHQSSQVAISDLFINSPHDPVRSPSTDGIDIDSSTNVHVWNCEIDTDDDCIAIKSGKGDDAHLVDPASENILVEKCRFGFGHGALTIGSEAALVRNVTLRDSSVNGPNNSVRLKFRNDTTQIFENILFENLRIKNSTRVVQIKPWVCRQDDILADGLPSVVRNLVIRDIEAENVNSAGMIQGEPGIIDLENVLLENIRIHTNDGPGAPEKVDTHDEGAFDTDPVNFPLQGCKNLQVRKVFLNGKALA